MRLPGFRRRRPSGDVDVAVVGTGLPAVAVALELARRRARVVVLGGGVKERPRGLGLVLLGPGRPYARVARGLGRSNARLVWAAGCESHLRLRALLEEARRECGYAARGSFLLALERGDAAELAESEDMLREDGFPGEFLDHYMLETRFDLQGLAGAYWAAEDAEVDAAQVSGALVEMAREAGVGFDPGPVRLVAADAAGAAVEAPGGIVRAASAVVATDGAASGLLPELRGLLRPTAPSRVRAAPLPGAVLPTALRTSDGRFAWQARTGAIVVAESGPAERLRPGDLERLLTRVPVGPASSRWDEPAEVGADGLPLVGRLPGRALAVACGFGVACGGLAFAAARWVADALLSGSDPTPEPLRPTRSPAPF